MSELSERRAAVQAAKLTEAVRNRARCGQVLSNGATVVAISDTTAGTDFHEEYIVLAVVTNTHQPYVTWRYVVGIEQRADGTHAILKPYCVHGHYFHRLEDAVASFNERSQP